jgi:ketopantoate hydroxymethyltransferase
VFHDILGLYGSFVPKHARQYAQLENTISEKILQYVKDVRGRVFPLEKHSAHLDSQIIKSISDKK